MPDTWFDRTHAGGAAVRKKKTNSFVAEAVKRVPNRDIQPAPTSSGEEEWRRTKAAERYLRNRGGGGGDGSGSEDEGGMQVSPGSTGRRAGSVAAEKTAAVMAAAEKRHQKEQSATSSPWISRQDVDVAAKSHLASRSNALPPGSNRAQSTALVESFMASNGPDQGAGDRTAAGSTAPHTSSGRSGYGGGAGGRGGDASSGSAPSPYTPTVRKTSAPPPHYSDRAAGIGEDKTGYQQLPAAPPPWQLPVAPSSGPGSGHSHRFHRPPPAAEAEALFRASASLHASQSAANAAATSLGGPAGQPPGHASGLVAYPSAKPPLKSSTLRLPWETPESFTRQIVEQHSSAAVRAARESRWVNRGGWQGRCWCIACPPILPSCPRV